MASLRHPKFYGELKQLNDDLLKLFEGSHKKSAYFDYTDTFQDYIKQVEELTKKFPVLPEGDTTEGAKSTTDTDISTNNVGHSLFGNSVINTSSNSTFNDSTSNNIFPMHTQSDHSYMAAVSSTNGTVAAEDPDGEYAPPQPSVDLYEEPDYKYQAKCKLYERSLGGGSSQARLMGCGVFFIKDMNSAEKLHVVVRKDPDLRTILLNQVITSSTPLRLLSKAVQIVTPDASGKTVCHIVKVKDENVASEIYNMLKSIRLENAS